MTVKYMFQSALIPGDLLRRAKAVAGNQGKTINELIVAAVEDYVKQHELLKAMCDPHFLDCIDKKYSKNKARH